MERFLGNFECADDVFREFQVKKEDTEGIEILFAYYTYEDYSGNAYVLYKKDGELYDVEGSHCSCNGLEEQWEPTVTSEEALMLRVNKGGYTYDKEMDTKIKKYLGLALFNLAVEEELATDQGEV